jgi:hypothetical protein
MSDLVSSAAPCSRGVRVIDDPRSWTRGGQFGV